MKPFVYKLQTALDIKTKEEDRTKEALQKATRFYRESIEVLEGLKGKLLEVQEKVRINLQNSIEQHNIKVCLDFILVLNERIKNQEVIIENRRIEMEKVRAGLLIVMKERKVLEKLKERHYKEYLKECLREEQKMIDEMATISYARKASVL